MSRPLHQLRFLQDTPLSSGICVYMAVCLVWCTGATTDVAPPRGSGDENKRGLLVASPLSPLSAAHTRTYTHNTAGRSRAQCRQPLPTHAGISWINEDLHTVEPWLDGPLVLQFLKGGCAVDGLETPKDTTICKVGL